ncbi:hypothetical protein HZS_894 [Henneguya salminicola]|uniref:DNA-directed RNA polymerases I, II, and III subunit RPABC3 (Trinotate prediction) n=1 Tax=Henneguya salminicola TaxID=69463 RepID=A0A6G3MJR7_HENSL|nr:hypothetical protein HZS_894 [Henneguya salminicola]
MVCDSEGLKTSLILDVNTQIYPMHVGEKFRMVLTSTLNEDGSASSDFYNRLMKPPAFMDHFDYVMYGKVYRIEDLIKQNQNAISIYVSFGGLLMNIKGETHSLSTMEVDKNIYILVKKLAF